MRAAEPCDAMGTGRPNVLPAQKFGGSFLTATSLKI
jgi:hypothetical protein